MENQQSLPIPSWLLHAGKVKRGEASKHLSSSYWMTPHVLGPSPFPLTQGSLFILQR